MGRIDNTRPTRGDMGKDEQPKDGALEAARKEGVLGLLAQTPGGAFASITGTADFSSGISDRDVYGGLLGDEVGEMAGGWGYGGGGTGWGTIGTGSGGMRGRKAKPPQVRIGNVSSTGELDKNIIRRYIRRKLPRIRDCYEKELLVKTKLAGTVVTQFQISPSGNVQGETAKGIGNTNVETCVASAIKSIQFPKPKGGGYVNVRYPFTFSPAEGAPAANLDADGGMTPDGSINSPLVGHEPALDACFRHAKADYGVVVVEMGITADGKIASAKSLAAGDEATAACVAEVAKATTPKPTTLRTLRCPIAFGVMPMEKAANVIDIGKSLSIHGQDIVSTDALAKNTKMEWKIVKLYELLLHTAKIAKLSSGQEVISITGPSIIRPTDTTPMKVVLRVLKNTSAADPKNWVLAAQQGNSWRFLHEGLRLLPVQPIPIQTGVSWSIGRGLGRYAGLEVDGPPVQLSLLVTNESVWVGLTTGDRRMIAKQGVSHDWKAVAETLEEHKKLAAFTGRQDIEISAEDEVMYKDLVAAIDASNQNGFTKWSIIDPQSLSVRFKE